MLFHATLTHRQIVKDQTNSRKPTYPRELRRFTAAPPASARFGATEMECFNRELFIKVNNPPAYVLQILIQSSTRFHNFFIFPG
jgi:hypothetical protein